MTIRIRFSVASILVVTTICALLLAFQIFVARILVPDNHRTASTICQAIGSEFARTGDYPRGTILKWSEIKKDYGLAIREVTNTGHTENRWDEEIGLIVAIFNNPDGSEELDLSVVSTGPFGLGYVSRSEIYQFNANSTRPENEKN